VEQEAHKSGNCVSTFVREREQNCIRQLAMLFGAGRMLVHLPKGPSTSPRPRGRPGPALWLPRVSTYATSTCRPTMVFLILFS
jgi:hypothetical protein